MLGSGGSGALIDHRVRSWCSAAWRWQPTRSRGSRRTSTCWSSRRSRTAAGCSRSRSANGVAGHRRARTSCDHLEPRRDLTHRTRRPLPAGPRASPPGIPQRHAQDRRAEHAQQGFRRPQPAGRGRRCSLRLTRLGAPKTALSAMTIGASSGGRCHEEAAPIARADTAAPRSRSASNSSKRSSARTTAMSHSILTAQRGAR
jgi:hypothetical protein